jgi:hypothetical protein
MEMGEILAVDEVAVPSDKRLLFFKLFVLTTIFFLFHQFLPFALPSGNKFAPSSRRRNNQLESRRTSQKPSQRIRRKWI